MKKIVCAMMFSILFLIGCTKSETQTLSYTSITMKEAKEIIENTEDYILVDVRTEQEYKEGHIPGAIHIPNERIRENEIKELSNKEQKILVYCRSGNRSQQAASQLAKQGYTNVYEIGGIKDWSGDIIKESQE